MTTKGADIYYVFWQPVDGQENKHKCKRCGIHWTQRVKSGYSNLKDHLNAEHPDWPDAMKMFYAEGRGPMDTLGRTFYICVYFPGHPQAAKRHSKCLLPWSSYCIYLSLIHI